MYPFGREEHLYGASGNKLSSTYYYSLDGQLLGSSDGTTTSFFIVDAEGTPLTSFKNQAGSATINGNQVYSPYGTRHYHQGLLGTSKGFTGQYADWLSGLDYYNARYYDPVVGRFISADTVQGNLQGMDPYAYVVGNPETLTDPTGKYHVCPDNGCLSGGGSPGAVDTGGGASGNEGGSSGGSLGSTPKMPPTTTSLYPPAVHNRKTETRFEKARNMALYVASIYIEEAAVFSTIAFLMIRLGLYLMTVNKGEGVAEGLWGKIEQLAYKYLGKDTRLVQDWTLGASILGLSAGEVLGFGVALLGAAAEGSALAGVYLALASEPDDNFINGWFNAYNTTHKIMAMPQQFGNWVANYCSWCSGIMYGLSFVPGLTNGLAEGWQADEYISQNIYMHTQQYGDHLIGPAIFEGLQN